jgi:hypothetical protein
MNGYELDIQQDEGGYTMNDSMRWTMWGIVKGLISTTKLYGFQESARIIAEQLEGETPLEKLAQFELGEKNRIITEEGDKVLVVLKQCPFAQVYREMPEWGGEEELLERFNAHPGGGGALHSFCLLHCYIRENLGGLHNLACRSADGKVIAIAREVIKSIGLSEELVEKLIEGNACVYAVQKL